MRDYFVNISMHISVYGSEITAQNVAEHARTFQQDNFGPDQQEIS